MNVANEDDNQSKNQLTTRRHSPPSLILSLAGHHFDGKIGNIDSHSPVQYVAMHVDVRWFGRYSIPFRVAHVDKCDEKISAQVI